MSTEQSIALEKTALGKTALGNIVLGAIADDFTGATDLANNLVRGGMRCLQVIGVPQETIDSQDVDAVVVALKSRSCPVDEAITILSPLSGCMGRVPTAIL